MWDAHQLGDNRLCLLILQVNNVYNWVLPYLRTWLCVYKCGSWVFLVVVVYL